MGMECLIGVVPLEVMDLIIDPKLQRLVGRLPGRSLHSCLVGSFEAPKRRTLARPAVDFRAAVSSLLSRIPRMTLNGDGRWPKT
jgi:hypothetical protein